MSSGNAESRMGSASQLGFNWRFRFSDSIRDPAGSRDRKRCFDHSHLRRNRKRRALAPNPQTRMGPASRLGSNWRFRFSDSVRDPAGPRDRKHRFDHSHLRRNRKRRAVAPNPETRMGPASQLGSNCWRLPPPVLGLGPGSSWPSRSETWLRASL